MDDVYEYIINGLTTGGFVALYPEKGHVPTVQIDKERMQGARQSHVQVAGCYY